MKYQLLEQLLPILDAFEKENKSAENSVSDFAQWVLRKEKENSFSERMIAKGESIADLQMRFADNCRLIVRMYRYAKILGKKAISSDSAIAFDDYSYLVPLYYVGKMTKMQLIQQNIHEKSTGMEIIKRLLKLDLIAQEDNFEDKRSKYVFLTEKGKSEMKAIQANMWNLATTVNGNLTQEETLSLYSILEKLDVFHQQQL